MENSICTSIDPRRPAATRNVGCSRITKVCFLEPVDITTSILTSSLRWLVRVKGADVAINTLAKLRNLPVDAPYVQEEAAAIVRQIEEERLLVSGKGLIAEFKELFGPNNRYRIFLGVMIFIFMQMAGSNAINVSGTAVHFQFLKLTFLQYYSPRIFASIGLKGGSTTLVSTGIYGVVRFVAVIIAMLFFVDQFGRTKLLIYGSALMVSHDDIISASSESRN